MGSRSANTAVAGNLMGRTEIREKLRSGTLGVANAQRAGSSRPVADASG